VHHLDEGWSTTSGHFIDSTSYGHDGTLSDGDADSMSDSGMIGDGFRFSGDGDNIDIGVVDHGQPISFSCWLKADDIDLNGCALGRFYFGYFLGTWASGSGVLRHNVYVDGTVLYNVEGGVLSDEWYYLSVSYDGSVVRYYVNGVEVGSRSFSGSLSNTNYRWHIGDDGHGGFPFAGVVDEVRIGNFCFSDAWFNACFDNVISDDFYVVGGEEDQSNGPPVLSDEFPVDGSVNVDLNPTLQVEVLDGNGDDVEWEIWSNASGSWSLLQSSLLVGGMGVVSADTVDMDEFGVWYWWSVHVSDLLGSGLWVNETYSFMTRLDNVPPVLSNPVPSDGSVGIVSGVVVLQITVNDVNDDFLDIMFRTNASGVWEDIGSNISQLNGIYSQQFYFGQSGFLYWWSVNCSDGISWTNNTYNFITEIEPDQWWDAGWFYRKEIVVDHVMVDSDLFSFPLLVDIVDADLAVKAQVDADDIVFTDKAGSVLSHEIERFDDVTGGLVVWVNVPCISSLESTSVYMYYGNPSCGNQEDVGGTWSSDFMTVHHLDEGWSTTSGHFIDSTSYGHDGNMY